MWLHSYDSHDVVYIVFSDYELPVNLETWKNTLKMFYGTDEYFVHVFNNYFNKWLLAYSI